MTTKEQIIQELEQIPEALMDEVLAFVRSLKAQHQKPQHQDNEVWQAYLTSKRKREEVYRRLADS